MRCTPVITHNKRISTPPTLAGLFFCFASAKDAGLLFLLYCNTATYKRLQRVLFRPCSYTANTTKQHVWLYRRVSCDLSNSTDADTRPTQAAIIPPAPRWSVSQRLDGLHRYPRYQRHAGRCTGQHSRPIIIRYIRAHGCGTVVDPCQTVQHIADHASPAGSRCFPRLTLA